MAAQCVAGAACRAAHVNSDGQREGAYLTDGVLCAGCATGMRSAIRNLPHDWKHLRDALGEQSPTVEARIRSTPTPAMPISARKEALMAAIAETLDRAATLVSDRLHGSWSTTGQTPTPASRVGSIAWCAAHHTRKDPSDAVRAAVALVEPNLDVLAAAGAEPAMVWKNPGRCEPHTDQILLAETLLASAMEMPEMSAAGHKKIRRFLRDEFRRIGKENQPLPIQAMNPLEQLNNAYRAAGACEDCNGWGNHGQEREVTELTGIDIALQLVDLHHQTRAELGETRLRHTYAMPCPRCGGRVGRDDGTTIVDCRDCKSSWTQREYDFFAGLVIEERMDMEILKWLLAQAYWRLDVLNEAADVIRNNEFLDSDPAGGRIVLEVIDGVLAGHILPAQRVIATDRKTTEARQTDDDTRAWVNETPYQPPGHKPHPPKPDVKNPIHPGSLLTVVDVDTDVVINGDARCRECNLIHQGECA